MVIVRPFKADDLNEFVPIEPMDKDELKEPKLAKAIEDSGLAITGVKNGKVVGCGGVHPLSDEQGELWLRLSEECLKHRMDTLLWLTDGLEIISETFPFRQLNAVVRKTYKTGIKLVKVFGFKEIQYKDDLIIYAKVVKQ